MVINHNQIKLLDVVINCLDKITRMHVSLFNFAVTVMPSIMISSQGRSMSSLIGSKYSFWETTIYASHNAP